MSRVQQGLKSRLLSGSVWSFVGKVSGTTATLAVNALLARLLPPAEVGGYLLISSLVTAAALLAQFGIPPVMVRLIAEARGTGDAGRAKSVINAGFRSGTVCAALIAVVVGLGGREAALAIPGRFGGLVPLLPFAGGWILLLAWQSMQSAVFKGNQQFHHCVVFGGVGNSVVFALLLCFIWHAAARTTVETVVMAAVAAAAIGAVAGGFVLLRKTKELPFVAPLPLQELLKPALPVLVVTVAGAVLNQADLWVLGLFRSPEEVAVYGAASRLAATIPFFLMIGNTVMSPVIAELSVQGRTRELESVLRKGAFLSFVPALLPLVFFLACGGEVLGTIFGHYYRTGSPVLIILALGRAFTVWTGPCGLTLMMTGHQAMLMKITTCCSVLTVAVSAASAKTFGGPGVACAMSLGLILQNVAMLLCTRRLTGIWTHAPLGVPSLRPVTREDL